MLEKDEKMMERIKNGEGYKKGEGGKKRVHCNK